MLNILPVESNFKKLEIILFLVLLFGNLSSCGNSNGGGGGNPAPPTQTIVSGVIQAPNGQIVFVPKQDILSQFAHLILHSANAIISGLTFVPDGTAVELDKISDNGSILTTLATSTTTNGYYSFNLTKLNLSFSSNLIVRVSNSNTGIQMRAFVGIGITNINPTTEAAVIIVLDTISANPGNSLANFTPQEENDITASVDLFSTVNNLGSGVDINSTVAVIKKAVLVDRGVMSFINSTSAAGQTTNGPGDIGNYMPVSTGNTWNYKVQTAPSSGSQTSFTETDSFTGTTNFKGIAVSVLTSTTTGPSATSTQNYFVKNSIGYFEYGDNNPTDFLLPQIAPVTMVIFPIQPGRTFGQIIKTGLNYGQDLDGDGIPETFDINYSSTYIDFEPLTVPAGTFLNSIKITTNITLTLTFSKTKQHGIITITEDSWLAPGIGPVKSKTTTQGYFNSSLTSSEVNTNELTGAIVDNTGIGLRLQISPSISPTGINFPTSASVIINSTQQFSVQAFDQANNPFYGLTYSWNLSPTGVAIINSSGLATGQSLGSTLVTASAGGIVSNPIPLNVLDINIFGSCLQPCYMVFDPFRGKIYASPIQNSVGSGNSVVTIDPITGMIGPTIFVSNSGIAGKLALSDDGQFLYVAINGSSTISPSIQRINLATSSLDIQFGVTSNPPSNSSYGIFDMKVLPGSPHSVAVVTSVSQGYPSFTGLTVYDDGSPRQKAIQGWSSSGYEIDRIEFSSVSSTLYGINLGVSVDFYRISIDSTGASLIDVTKSLINSNYNVPLSIKFDGGLVYSSSGQVIDPSGLKPKVIGTFAIPGQDSQIILDSAHNKVYFLYDDPTGIGVTDLSVFSLSSFQLLNSMMIENGGNVLGVSLDGSSVFVRTASNTFGFTSYGRFVLIKSPF